MTPDRVNSRVTQLREKQAVEMMGNDSSALEVAYKLAGVESCQISPLLERLDLKKLNRGWVNDQDMWILLWSDTIHARAEEPRRHPFVFVSLMSEKNLPE